jgi:hypothetical protein
MRKHLRTAVASTAMVVAAATALAAAPGAEAMPARPALASNAVTVKWTPYAAAVSIITGKWNDPVTPMFVGLKVTCAGSVCRFQFGKQNDDITGEMTISQSNATTLSYSGHYTASNPMTPGSVTTQLHGTFAIAKVGSGQSAPTELTYALSALGAYAGTLYTRNADGVCATMTAAGQQSFLASAGLSGPCVATLTSYFRTAPTPSGWPQMSAFADAAPFRLRNGAAVVTAPPSFSLDGKRAVVITFTIDAASDLWLINRFAPAP